VERKDPPKVTLIEAAAFAYVCNQPGTELFFLSMSELQKAQLSSQVDTDATKIEFNLLMISPEYHEFASLFDKKQADKLPPHWSYDHMIPLESGTTPTFRPIC
jgi:hypothetical protein